MLLGVALWGTTGPQRGVGAVTESLTLAPFSP